MKVSVLALGSWGTAISKVLAENSHEVMGWARDSKLVEELIDKNENTKYLPGVKLPKIEYTDNIKKAVAHGKDMIVFAVPTQNFRQIFLSVYGLIGKDTIVVNVSKGIEISSGSTISQIVGSISGSVKNYCVLSGPTHAEEVGRRFPAAIVAASVNSKVALAVQQAFSNSYLRVYTNHDVDGVEISGATKNIIALGSGISDGLGFGDNAKAALITRGIHEIARFGVALGASMMTFTGLAGLGDMIVTCTSKHSRNRNFGYLIGKGDCPETAKSKVGMVVEGYYTTEAVINITKNTPQIDMPIINGINDVLFNNVRPDTVLKSLMERRSKHETEYWR